MVMGRLGFTAVANPCVYKHTCRELVVSVHVDDFLCMGDLACLSWLRGQLKNEFDLAFSILGNGAGENPEIKYLNRSIRLTTYGIT